MAQTVKEVIHVTALGKWGPKVGDEYLSWSKNIKDADKGKVVPGGEYECELYIADSGKRYINSVHSFTTNQPGTPTNMPKLKPSLPKPEVKSAFDMKPGTIKLSDAMSKAEWSAKDRSQLIGGLSHDAAAITAAFAPLSVELDTAGALKLYKELLVGMLQIRDEVK